MHLYNSASRAASLAVLLLLSPEVNAQSNPSNQNITLRFFQDTGIDDTTCSYTDSQDALTFTTESIPLLNHCFDFRDLFSGNQTQGFVNQTENLGSGITLLHDPGIRWQLFNTQKFSRQANFSRVLYRQHVASPSHERYQPGHYADRVVTIYPGEGCTQLDPDDKNSLLPWYGFSCWSEDQGSCGVMPYSIASFSIQPGRSDDEKDNNNGACWVFAKEGGGVTLKGKRSALMAALAGLSVAFWLGV